MLIPREWNFHSLSSQMCKNRCCLCNLTKNNSVTAFSSLPFLHSVQGSFIKGVSPNSSFRPPSSLVRCLPFFHLTALFNTSLFENYPTCYPLLQRRRILWMISLVCSISSFSICMKIHTYAIPLLPSTSLKESYIEGIDTSDIFFSRDIWKTQG